MMNASNLEKESPARLLVVDDEDVTRRSLAEILRLEGYKVEAAEGGRAAIALLSKQAFDLVLLDLKMPDVDGLQVMRYIRRDSETSEGVNNAAAIIMLTAHGSLESAIEALRQGASDYLLKPISPEALLHSVAEGLRKRKERMPAQTRAGTGNRVQLPVGITIDLAKREAAGGSRAGVWSPGAGQIGARIRHKGLGGAGGAEATGQPAASKAWQAAGRNRLDSQRARNRVCFRDREAGKGRNWRKR